MAFRILQIIGTKDPAFGGPVEAARQLKAVMERMGHSVDGLTLDAPDAPWLQAPSTSTYAIGPSWGRYRYNRRLRPWLSAHLHRYDVVIVHGIWQYQSFGVWRAARHRVPYLVFVHGALDPWFKRTYRLKHLKKWLYWPWAEYRILRDAAGVLFTSEEERQLAAESFWLYRVNERVVEYGISAPTGDVAAEREAFLATYPRLRGKRLILFMSRLHKKKGLDLLIEAFARVADHHPDLHLVIAGPDGDGLRDRFITWIEGRGLSARITWTGMLRGEMKSGAYHAADAFCLPSHSENFGIVVAEALARRLPVLISDKVNIWREINAAGAGLVAPDTPEGTLSLLQHWLELPTEACDQMRDRARSCFDQHFEIDNTARTLVNVVQSVVKAQASHEGAGSLNMPE